MKKTRSGFTLIELLVVISIIGILASIVLASLDSSRKKGRDARRLADVKQIQLALELYYDQNNSFPAGGGADPAVPSGNHNGYCLTAAQLVSPGYISNIPTDPSNQVCYDYVAYSLSSGLTAPYVSYHLGASLESAGHTAFQTDADLPAQSGGAPKNFYPANVSVDFDGKDTNINGSTNKCNSSDYGVECYDVTP